MHLLPLIALAQAALLQASAPAGGQSHDGRRGQLDVRIPRIEAEAPVDGRLDEPAWREAARLTGFSQYAPADRVPAADSTEVLVWYSPTAIHFGVRAHARPGTVNANLADRDRIFSDDHVGIFLGTFNDGRQATVFYANPLGIQADGVINERGVTAGGGFAGAVDTREPVDLSPDFVWQSRGRLTDFGWEVEIRIPFKSLRYQSASEQTWGLHVVRRVQARGAEDSWAPAVRAGASFLAQGGRLAGLQDLRRGLVVDLNPVATMRAPGRTAAADGAWTYVGQDPQFGGNARWGITNNLTLNGTVRPDFAEVEADVAQVQFDPRSALFFPERRPFFLEGIEQFAVPNNLVYTRTVVQPDAAAKLVGKVAGTNVALLSAVDTRAASLAGDGRPIFNILRAQRDVGRQSRLGVLYTDRVDGEATNRVAAVDGRLVFRSNWALSGQYAGSWTENPDGSTLAGPLWNATLTRTGRRFGLNYRLNANDPDFRTLAGFISRRGIAGGRLSQRFTAFGARDAFLQSVTTELAYDNTWRYDDFLAGRRSLEEKLHLNVNSQLRGGWRAGASALVEEFRYDSSLYADYYIDLPRAGSPGARDTVRYVGTPALPNLDWVITLGTPRWARFSGDLFVVWGKDENFFEWSSADIVFSTLDLAYRPTDQLRVNFLYTHQQFDRITDGSTVGMRRIPRLRLEYQFNRAIFFRLVGQYVADERDALRDDSRTGAPILRRAPNGTFVPQRAYERNSMRADWLFSWFPNPGTVFYAGYGSDYAESDPLRFRELARQRDAFFVKFSYLYRLP